MKKKKIISLGIDPGTATVGFGVIEKTKKNLKVLDYGTITTFPSTSYPERLEKIEKEIKKIITKYSPRIIAVESLFFFKNLKTAIKVSEVKGIILLTAAKKRIPIIEITPLQVKMAICGYGKASKKQIQQAIKELLHLKDIPKPDDAADALALSYVAFLMLKKPLTKQFEII